MPGRGRSARESAGATTVACTEEQVTSAEVGKQEKYFGLGHILPMPGGKSRKRHQWYLEDVGPNQMGSQWWPKF